MLAGALVPARAALAQAPAPGRPLLVKGGTVLSLDPAIGPLPKADVLIQAGIIRAIEPQIAIEGAEEIDATDQLVMPGFVDTHRHMWEGQLRHTLPDGSLADYLAEILQTVGPRYRPEDVYIGNLLSAVSALDAGITSILDWSHIQNTPEHTDAAIAGLAESGLRAVFAFGAPQLGRRWWEDESHACSADLPRLRKQYFSSADQLLTPGKQADLITLRKTDPNLVPFNDPVGAIVLGADRGNVDTVLVAGEVRKRGGVLVGVDTARLDRLARASAEYLLRG